MELCGAAAQAPIRCLVSPVGTQNGNARAGPLPEYPHTLAILLVEDSDGDARLTGELLAHSSEPLFAVTHVTGIGEACRAVAKTQIDCILLDLSLPDAEGLEGLAELRAATPDTPIIILSSLEDEQVALEAIQTRAQDYLIKGRADSESLARAIRHAIERQRLDVELSQLALHDPLTGLPNRALLVDRLEHELARLGRHPGSVAVLFIDLDGFKPLNDSLGHAAGDRVLIEVGHRLLRAVRPSDTVARFGGDEFVVLCADIEDESDIATIAQRVREAISEPFLPEGREARLSASVGIATTSQPDVSPDALIHDADAAMYHVKRRPGQEGIPDSNGETDDETLRTTGLLLARTLAGDSAQAAPPGSDSSPSPGPQVAAPQPRWPRTRRALAARLRQRPGKG